ncbi:MAG: quinol:electron acceptor oxidoreductase subunit ActD [Chlorobiota bacterium]
MSKLYSIAALFDTPNSIMDAAAKVQEAGYENYDVNTPYPVHGMDGQMKLRPSKMGYYTITIGLTFMSLMLYFMYWVYNIDYPQVIGGKPLFPLPAFVPIMFEVTVLTGAVLTVAIMIIFYFKFPNNSHPLHDTDYMKSVSSDKFGICIEAKDPKFDINEVKELLKSLGASKVDEIYFDEEEVNYKNKVLEPKFVIGLIAIAGFTSLSVYLHMNKVLYLPPFDWMLVQHKVTAQDHSDFFDNGISSRPPVKGTVARGFMPYLYEDDIEGASENLQNPYPATAENIELGKRKYLTYCSPCHGDLAKGDSRLKGQFPNGPTLHSDKVVNWTDGRLYHVITQGQNVMPGYKKTVTRKERWSIVNYVRTLQRALDAKEEDMQ